MDHRYKFLEPFAFKNGLQVKNRVVFPPISEFSSLADGNVSEDELNYFRARTGGVGLFIVPAAYVSKLGKGYLGQISAEDDRFLTSLTKIARTVQLDGTRAVLQLFHAGRRGKTAVLGGEIPICPSPIRALRPNAEKPRAMTIEEIERTIQDYGEATRRAIEAGFDGVELHGANTYLIQQFFSAHSNRRTDCWGGSYEKRMKFPLAVIAEVEKNIKRYAKKPFILGYRISPEEIEIPGITLEEALSFIRILKNEPIDYLHVSMGDVWRTSLNNKDDLEPLIYKIKREVDGEIPLISVGGIRKPEEAEQVVQMGIDFVAVGQELLCEPKWVQKVETGKEKNIRYKLTESDLDEVAINATFWQQLITAYRSTLKILK